MYVFDNGHCRMWRGQNINNAYAIRAQYYRTFGRDLEGWPFELFISAAYCDATYWRGYITYISVPVARPTSYTYTRGRGFLLIGPSRSAAPSLSAKPLSLWYSHFTALDPDMLSHRHLEGLFGTSAFFNETYD